LKAQFPVLKNVSLETLMINDKLKNRIKRICRRMLAAALFLAAGMCLLPAAGGAELVDRIAAIVNEDVITLNELNEVLDLYRAKIASMGYSPEQEAQLFYKVREEKINSLIEKQLADQEIKTAEITASDDEVDSTIERIKAANFLTDEALRERLARDGSSLEKLRKEIKEQMLRTKLVNIKVKSNIVITEEDIKAFYDENTDAYQGTTEYYLKNIYMKTPLTENEKKQVLEKMNVILEKLSGGEPFEALAREYSESPLAQEGGELGRFRLDELSPQIRDAVQDLKAGEHTPVVETEHGYQIFLVKEIAGAGGKTFEEAMPEIREKLYNEKVDEKYNSWIEELKAHSHIKIIN